MPFNPFRMKNDWVSDAILDGADALKEKAIDSFSLVSREEFERLSARVDQLEQRILVLEEKQIEEK